MGFTIIPINGNTENVEVITHVNVVPYQCYTCEDNSNPKGINSQLFGINWKEGKNRGQSCKVDKEVSLDGQKAIV